MPKLDEIRKKFSADRFATEAAGIEILEALPQFARCRMRINPVHRNERGTPMGGAIFTLADFTAAVAMNGYAESTDTVSMHADITFLSAAKGNTLTAVAQCIKSGRSTAFYGVEVRDELDTLIAHATLNGFILKSE